MKGKILFVWAVICACDAAITRDPISMSIAIWTILAAIFWMLDDIRKEMK